MITLKYTRPSSEREAVSLPGSKSMAARALVLNALATEASRLEGLPLCEDTSAMRHALDIVFTERQAKVDIGAAGTAMRFMTALCAALPDVKVLLTGTDRMLHRPIAPIVDALRQIGGEIEYQRSEGYPPLLITGKKLKGGDVQIRADISSQFLSGLMMIAPDCQDGMVIRRKGDRTVSRPYIEMTAKMMRDFGAHIDEEGDEIKIQPGGYKAPARYVIEPDWSAASYFYEIAALLGSEEIVIKNLTPAPQSVQGDARCAQLFENLGVTTQYLEDGSAILRGGGPTRESDLDLSETPDLVPALALAHCLCGVPFQFKGIDHLRLKECDRLEVIVGELHKLGYVARTHDDVLSWDGEISDSRASEPIRTHDDHRIAMAFAPAVLKFKEIVILHEGVVDKSYPQYWNNLERLGVKIYY
ncbi:MAG: 3-phosphoshikimate 1-carboxyvinyltransferase [Bacteroides sp.]|nr:3-phosphoshikimate 1-carboxyvinyltransferase [Bacteroides sp.]